MRITTFRGEKSLLEITAKLFQDLAPELQERAAQALLLANPQLAFLTDVPVGAVILVPDVITARPKMTAGPNSSPPLILPEWSRRPWRIIAGTLPRRQPEVPRKRT